MRIELTPPPPRPVPDEVRHRLTAAVLDGISRNSISNGRRRWASPVLAIAAAVVTVVVVLNVVNVVLRQAPAPSDSAIPPDGWAAPITTDLGLSAAQTDSIVNQCLRNLGEWTGAAVTRDDVMLFNIFDDPYGRVAFVAGSRIAMTCQTGTGDVTYRDMGSTTPADGALAWMVRPVTIDVLVGGTTGHDSGPWAETVAGRVVTTATSVTFSAFGTTIDLPVVNGTYVGRIVFLNQSENPANYTVTARDSAGNVVGSLTVGQGKTCAVTPNGVVIGDDWGTNDCPPAVLWQ